MPLPLVHTQTLLIRKRRNYQDGVAMQVEGNAKDKANLFIEASVKVETIATFFRVSRQCLMI